MNLDSVRTRVRDTAFDLFGLDATVTLPGGAPTPARVIWGQNLEEDQPYGRDYSRAGPRRLMTIERNGFTAIPRGTIVNAVEKFGAAATDWQVDAHDSTERGTFTVRVVPKTVTP